MLGSLILGLALLGQTPDRGGAIGPQSDEVSQAIFKAWAASNRNALAAREHAPKKEKERVYLKVINRTSVKLRKKYKLSEKQLLQLVIVGCNNKWPVEEPDDLAMAMGVVDAADKKLRAVRFATWKVLFDDAVTYQARRIADRSGGLEPLHFCGFRGQFGRCSTVVKPGTICSVHMWHDDGYGE